MGASSPPQTNVYIPPPPPVPPAANPPTAANGSVQSAAMGVRNKAAAQNGMGFENTLEGNRPVGGDIATTPLAEMKLGGSK